MNVSDIVRLNMNLRRQQNSVLHERSIETLMLASQRISIEFEPNIVVLSRRPPFES
jgi:hypothetical protein